MHNADLVSIGLRKDSKCMEQVINVWQGRTDQQKTRDAREIRDGMIRVAKLYSAISEFLLEELRKIQGERINFPLFKDFVQDYDNQAYAAILPGYRDYDVNYHKILAHGN